MITTSVAIAERLREMKGMLDFARFCEALSEQKHTGPITIHFAQGHPNSIEVPCEPARIKLDTGRRRRA